MGLFPQESWASGPPEISTVLEFFLHCYYLIVASEKFSIFGLKDDGVSALRASLFPLWFDLFDSKRFLVQI